MLTFMVGPSGGHFFPFLRLVQYLRKREVKLPLLFTGWLPGYLREIALKENIPFLQLPLKRRSEGKINFYSHLMLSLLKFLPRVKKIVPSSIISSGGYPSSIGGIAARLKGIPLILYEPNVIPGKTNLYLARWASIILAGFPETSIFFPGKKVITVGIPVGNTVISSPHPPTILILGGSQGSHFLNTALPLILQETLPSHFHIIHVSGERDYHEVKKLYQNSSFSCQVYPFYYPMEELYAKTDYCISRGGAITLWELATWNIPTLVFPLLTSYTSHQLDNAYYFGQFAPFEVGKEKEAQKKIKEFISSPPSGKKMKELEEKPEEKIWEAIKSILSK